MFGFCLLFLLVLSHVFYLLKKKRSMEARLEDWGDTSVGKALGEQRRGMEFRSPDSK